MVILMFQHMTLLWPQPVIGHLHAVAPARVRIWRCNKSKTFWKNTSQNQHSLWKWMVFFASFPVGFQALLLVSGRVQDNNRYCHRELLELWRYRNQCLHESIPLQTSGSKPSFLHVLSYVLVILKTQRTFAPFASMVLVTVSDHLNKWWTSMCGSLVFFGNAFTATTFNSLQTWGNKQRLGPKREGSPSNIFQPLWWQVAFAPSLDLPKPFMYIYGNTFDFDLVVESCCISIRTSKYVMQPTLKSTILDKWPSAPNQKKTSRRFPCRATSPTCGVGLGNGAVVASRKKMDVWCVGVHTFP